MSKSLPSTHLANCDPCLNEASHSRRKSVSLTPICFNVDRIVGQVPSPTPMGGCWRDSTSVMATPCSPRRGYRDPNTPATSQPAVPPPTITILRTDPLPGRLPDHP